MSNKPWSKDDLEYLKLSYGEVPIAEIADMLGRTRSAIRNKVYAMGWRVRFDNWTQDEIDLLVKTYKTGKRGEVIKLEKALGRARSSISAKAAEFGLTTRKRKGDRKPKESKAKFTDDERAAFRSKFMRERHRENGHPMLGKKHKPETLKKISKASKRAAIQRTKQEKSDIALKAQKTKAARGWKATHSRNGTWKAGWREIGGKRNYYRSRWEANYARYLQSLKDAGDIADWAHEPETFWFEAIKRGVRSYKPDFRVWYPDGKTNLHEVIGWMDARSKTTLKRMAKYHPDQEIYLLDSKAYTALAKKVKNSIDGWEHSGKSGAE